MGFNNFRSGVIVRVLTMVFVIASLAFMILHTNWYFTIFILGLLVVIQVFELIRYAESTSRDVGNFLKAIAYRDFTQNYNQQSKGKSFGIMRNAFNLINGQFQKISAEKEAHYQYLQAVVSYASIGLIAFDVNGNIDLYNQAAQELLSIPYINNINGIENKHSRFFEFLKKPIIVEPETIDIEQGPRIIQVSASKTQIKTQDKLLTLVSFQNISLELKAKEIEAWKKLISVLTHEIMNSITPIASVSNSSLLLLENEEIRNEEKMDDLKAGLKSIETRSKGLLSFVDVYRSLSKVPKPNLGSITAKELLDNVGNLMRKTVIEKTIDFEIEIREPGLVLQIDRELIEQVLLNLILNCIDAIQGKEGGLIKLISDKDFYNKPVILVKDNGKGMNVEIAENIFVPFFTTKKNGTGIGLSLSQQIMELHSGSISVKTKEGEGAVFILTF